MSDGAKQAAFSTIHDDDTPLYGHPALLVCGLSPDDQHRLLDLLAGLTENSLRVIFITLSDRDKPVGKLMTQKHLANLGQTSQSPGVIIVAGLAHQTLFQIMQRYRREALPRVMWATLTPYNETWPLSQLLAELTIERETLRRTSQSSPEGERA